MEAALQIMPGGRVPAPTTSDIGPVRVMGQSVHIPCRIYYHEPDEERILTLTGTQKILLSCLYSRHHDGYVRERHLHRLLPSADPWVPPFVCQLVGEYVIEIIDRILACVETLKGMDSYSTFSEDNEAFLTLTRQRVVSYWFCYCRGEYLSLRDYPGFRVMNALVGWRGKEGKRALKRQTKLVPET